MRIIIDVNTDGDAFQCDGDAEMRRVFSDAASTVFHAEHFGTGTDAESILFDSNGNRCGFVRLEYEPEREPAEPVTVKPSRCECGAARVTCGNCGAQFYGCASVCWKCGATDKGEPCSC